jgi:hypothetical protein
MDLAELQALDRSSRTVEIEVEGRRFTVLLPKQGQIDDATSRAVGMEGEGGGVPIPRITRLLLLDAVTGWDGVTLADLVDGCDPEPAPFTRGHLQLLVDDGGKVGAKLRRQFAIEVGKRSKQVEDLRKNSESV